MGLQIPANYTPIMNARETNAAIKRLKDGFESCLAEALNLTRVSAPLFVNADTGLNDNLSGVERPVSFETADSPDKRVEIVHSLAKWKRAALGRMGFMRGEGLYTDMNAIRRDENADNLHSYYVDQWDWEYVLDRSDRTRTRLHQLVEHIYSVFLRTEADLYAYDLRMTPVLPREITFITSQELEDEYPTLTPKQRENVVARKYGAVFIESIGGALHSGKPHDKRAPDYDDWTLNGDILFDYPLLNCAMEMSSMGIRVDEKGLMEQLCASGHEDWAVRPFHKALLDGELPLTAGGGIGQSRLCMFFLKKAHIGEVQSSLWPSEMVEELGRAGIELL
ncbi:MAG: aspartate--ammonia ligase [Candidatus Fimadaptatus sp.]|jgi:aspartate--ammonia ligase